MRHRFTPDEKVTYTVGTIVEWRNGGHWHTGVIAGPITPDQYSGVRGAAYVNVRNTSRKGGVPHGDVLPCGPTSVRLPAYSIGGSKWRQVIG